MAQRILEAYDINKDTPDEEAFPSVLGFANDIAYTATTLTMARGWDDNAYVYYFNEGNPWEGPWKGRASHILDVIYLFQNFHDFMSPEQVAVSIAFAEDALKFCYGDAPWPAVTPGDIENGFSARIYGPSQQGTTTAITSQATGGNTLRRSILFDCAETVSLDEFMKMFHEMMMS